MKKLHVGVDLALKADHRAAVHDPREDRFLDKSFGFDRSFEGYEHLLARVLEHVPKEEECQLVFIMEPTSGAWVPLSCYLIQRGYTVYRVTTQKSSDYRKFLSKHTKTDRVDAKALARLPVAMGKEYMYPVYLPTANLSALSRHSKQLAKVSKAIGARKSRIQSIFTMLNPKVMDAFGDSKFTTAARIFYRHFFNPFEVAAKEKESFFVEFRERLRKSVKDGVLEAIYQASVSAVKIYEPMCQNNTLPFDLEQIEAEIQTDLRLLETDEAELAQIQKRIEPLYRKIDPEGYLMSIRGIGKTIAPAILGIVGDVSRFPSINKFRKYFGFTPKKKQSSSKEIQSQPIDKAAQRLLKKYLFLASETARRWDPEFAAFYEKLLSKGLHHYQAVCAVANKMVGRVYAVLKRMQRAEGSNYRSISTTMNPEQKLKPSDVIYQLRDLDGHVISKQKAGEIIQEKFPSKAQKNRDAQQKKRLNGQNRKSENHETKKNRESIPSLKSLSDQPRQSTNDDSSKRSGSTLPVGVILKDILPEILGQHNGGDKNLAKLTEALENLRRQVSKQAYE